MERRGVEKMGQGVKREQNKMKKCCQEAWQEGRTLGVKGETKTPALAFLLRSFLSFRHSPREGSLFSSTERSSDCSALDVSIPALIRFSVT
jgi:hypothetical protein